MMKNLIQDIEQLLKMLKLKVCLTNYQAIAEHLNFYMSLFCVKQSSVNRDGLRI